MAKNSPFLHRRIIPSFLKVYMRTSFCLLFSLPFLLAWVPLSGEDRTDEVQKELTAPAPDWLTIGESIKVNPANPEVITASSFRPINGNASNPQNPVKKPATTPDCGMIQVVEDLSRRARSLSPDGKKLIINSGTVSRVYEILPDGSQNPIDFKLPRVTYDEGPKGFITGWSWADDTTLIGEALIMHEKQFIEHRLYVFHSKQKVLSRLDLSPLNLPINIAARLIVTEASHDLQSLKLAALGSVMTVSADLKSPPKLLNAGAGKQKEEATR